MYMRSDIRDPKIVTLAFCSPPQPPSVDQYISISYPRPQIWDDKGCTQSLFYLTENNYCLQQEALHKDVAEAYCDCTLLSPELLCDFLYNDGDVIVIVEQAEWSK